MSKHRPSVAVGRKKTWIGFCATLFCATYLLIPSGYASADFYVSSAANAEGDGSQEKPFASLEEARDAIRRLKSEGSFPENGVVVKLAEGTYRLDHSLELDESDSGIGENAPVTYQGSGPGVTVLSGGIVLEAGDFKPVTEEAILQKIPEAARSKVLQAELRVSGAGHYGDVPLSGHGMEFLENTTDYRSGLPAVEVFFDGRTLPVARWPNEGYVQIQEVVEIGSIPRLWQEDMIGKKTSFLGESGYVEPKDRENPAKGFAFKIDEDRVARWRTAKDAMLFGYWYHNWSDQTVQLAGVDENGVLRSVQPSAYGIREGQRLYVYNLLEELDAPGEWYLDREAGILYLLPPDEGLKGGRLEISLLAEPFVRMHNASHVILRDIGFSTSRAQGMQIHGGKNNLVTKCTFRQLAANAVTIRGGSLHAVVECVIDATGAGGIILSGGDRKNLVGVGHRAENNTITNFSRLVKTYSPAIDITGVGNAAIANRISDGPHVGIRFAGNNHLIEGNDISRVCLEADDMSAIYAGRDVTARGTIIRDNYIHDLPPPIGFEKPIGCHGVYLDDQFCGTRVEGNVFRNIGGLNVVINGGRDNTVVNNVFIVSPEFAQHVSGIWRFAAIGISDIGMDPRRVGQDGLPPNPDDIPYDTPAYANYPNIAGILSDEPLKPKYNSIEGNLCLGLPLFFYHQFQGTGITESQILEWNRIADNRVFHPGGKSK